MSKTRYSIAGELGKGGFGVVYLLKGDNGQKVRQYTETGGHGGFLSAGHFLKPPPPKKHNKLFIAASGRANLVGDSDW